MDRLDEVDNTYGVDQDTVRIHTNDEGVHVPESLSVSRCGATTTTAGNKPSK